MDMKQMRITSNTLCLVQAHPRMLEDALIGGETRSERCKTDEPESWWNIQLSLIYNIYL